MELDKISKKYGDRKMSFVNMHRHRATFKCLSRHDIVCTFIVEYGDDIQAEMLLKDIIFYRYEDLIIEIK